MASTLVTDRLILRAPAPGDVAQLAWHANDPAVARMVSMLPHPQPAIALEGLLLMWEARAALDRERVYAIDLPGRGAIGLIGLHAQDRDYQGARVELGYWLGRPFWGRGFATEAACAAARLGAAMGRGPVIARHYIDNPASGRVLAKAGFVYTGERAPLFCLARGRAVEAMEMQHQARAEAPPAGCVAARA